MGKTERNDIEIYFEWWLNELQEQGYIKSYDRESKVFQVFPSFLMHRMEYKKTILPKEKEYTLLGETNYSYDYKIIWNPKAIYLFHQPVDFSDLSVPQVMVYPKTFFLSHFNKDHNLFVSYCDVKPPGQAARFSGSLSSYHTFGLKQRALLWMHRIYINKTIPIPMAGAGKTISLFPITFTPRRYLTTDGGTRSRKIKFPIYTLQDYVKSRSNLIKNINNVQSEVRAKHGVSVGQKNLF